MAIDHDGSEDDEVYCLKQGGMVSNAASEVSRLTVEMLEAPDEDSDDSFAGLKGDKDELDINELVVDDVDCTETASNLHGHCTVNMNSWAIPKHL